MKLVYDNLEDARQKLVSTYCMYDKKAVIVKNVVDNGDGATFSVVGNAVFNGRAFHCELKDAKFDFANLNLGYAVRGDGLAAVWYFRKAMRQYRQGLRSDQVGMKYSSRRFADVSFNAHSKSVAAMLEGTYPDFKTVRDLLKGNAVIIGAFHRNFAATYDDIHDDVIIEYKGTRVGHSTNAKEFRLLNQYKFLEEQLMEAVG